MNSEKISGLLPFGLGVVAVTKEDNVDTIMFFPAEKLNFEYGKVDEIKDEIDVEVKDIKGNTIKAKVERKAMMSARWFQDGSDGRQTAPDVVSGETVQIYRFKDSKTFYWKTIMREPGLRRLEHVVYAYSNLASGREKFEEDSSYGNKWSTKDGLVIMWTSQSNGEAFAYNFKIDTKASTWSMWDNTGNGFGIESNQAQVYMRTSSGAFIEITGSKGSMGLSGGLDIEAPSVNVSGVVTSGKRMIAPSFVIGSGSTSLGNVPQRRMMRSSRHYKQNLDGITPGNDAGMALGDRCFIETGHDSGVELGDRSNVSLGSNSEVTLGEGSKIEISGTGQILVEGKDVIEFLRRWGF